MLRRISPHHTTNNDGRRNLKMRNLSPTAVRWQVTGYAAAVESTAPDEVCRTSNHEQTAAFLSCQIHTDPPDAKQRSNRVASAV